MPPSGTGRSGPGWRLRRAAAAAALLLAHPLATGASSPRVRIVHPRPAEIVSGPSLIEAEVVGMGGVSVEFFVDGQPAGVARVPPFRVEFDFGDSLASRRVRAVVRDPNGSDVVSEVATRAFDAGGVNETARVDLVNLYVTVRDAGGRFLPGLRQEDFTVLENGRPQVVSHFSAERKRLVAALVLDSSLSMKSEDRIGAAKEAAIDFLDRLEPDDRASVLCFNTEVRLLQGETSDRRALADAIRRCEPVGGTALYDAVYRTADRLAPIDGRKVIILLSDGRDESESGLEPGSLHTLEEALDKTLRSEVILYAVGVGKNLDHEMDFPGRRTLGSILEQMASSTGGRAIFLRRASQLRETFEEIGEELRRQYSVAYSSSDARRDGGWRELRVSVAAAGASVSTRRGYFAPRSPGGRG